LARALRALPRILEFVADFSHLSLSERTHLASELDQRGLSTLLDEVQVIRDGAVRALISGTPADFERLRGRVQAFDQVLELRQSLKDDLTRQGDDDE